MRKLREGWWRAVATIPAVMLLALALNACAPAPGQDKSDPDQPIRNVWVDTGDGRVVNCLYFGGHAGYSCDWENAEPRGRWVIDEQE